MPIGTPEKKSKNMKNIKSKLNMSAIIPEKNVRKEITIKNPRQKSISESETNNNDTTSEEEEEGFHCNKKSSPKIISRNPEKHTKIEICPEYQTVSKVKACVIFYLCILNII